MLQNSVSYTEPVYDPLFIATVNSGDNRFWGDNYYNTIACLDQVQFCNPGSGNCTSLTHIVAAYEEALSLGFNTNQQVVLKKTAILDGVINVAASGLEGLGSRGKVQRSNALSVEC